MIWARLDGPDTGALLPEVLVVVCSRVPRAEASDRFVVCCCCCAGVEDDIDIGGCVLKLLHARVGVGRLLLHGGGVAHVLLPPWRWWEIVII